MLSCIMETLTITDIQYDFVQPTVPKKLTLSQIPLNRHISIGNKKLPKTTAIFNMGAATDCPSLELGLCQAFVGEKLVCYAMKAESGLYPDVLPYRRRQESF